MKKKIFIYLLCLSFIIILLGCGKKDKVIENENIATEEATISEETRDMASQVVDVFKSKPVIYSSMLPIINSLGETPEEFIINAVGVNNIKNIAKEALFIDVGNEDNGNIDVVIENLNSNSVSNDSIGQDIPTNTGMALALNDVYNISFKDKTTKETVNNSETPVTVKFEYNKSDLENLITKIKENENSYFRDNISIENAQIYVIENENIPFAFPVNGIIKDNEVIITTNTPGKYMIGIPMLGYEVPDDNSEWVCKITPNTFKMGINSSVSTLLSDNYQKTNDKKDYLLTGNGFFVTYELDNSDEQTIEEKYLEIMDKYITLMSMTDLTEEQKERYDLAMDKVQNKLSSFIPAWGGKQAYFERENEKIVIYEDIIDNIKLKINVTVNDDKNIDEIDYNELQPLLIPSFQYDILDENGNSVKK